MDTYKEEFLFSDRKITVTYQFGFFKMLWHTTIRPFFEPLQHMAENIKSGVFTGIAYGIIAYWQGLFETTTIIGLLKMPEDLVTGLFMLVAADFLCGSFRALTDARVKFTPKKWVKSIFKVATYTACILVVSIGANMFPTPFSYLQYGAFLMLSGVEIWSCLKHLKLTSLVFVAWELYKKRGDLSNINLKELIQKVDEHSSKEFAEKQIKYYGNETVETEFYTKQEPQK